MKQSREFRFKQIVDGSDRSMSAGILRAAGAGAEPIYSIVMRMRNKLYDAGILSSHTLGRPTISVGNITTGGTGKTPVVQWLAARLLKSGQHPAILIRGYKTTSLGVSDEQTLLAASGVPVIANPDRRQAAAVALREHPEINLFILDDGMQHRAARRDFELVLIHAAEPFGFGRVFPRGMLREPLAGLARANAFLMTHADEVDSIGRADITAMIRKFNIDAPIFECDHVVQSVQNIAGKRYFAFCGIGSPAGFFRGLAALGGTCVETRALDDHHDYTEAEIVQLGEAARSAGAELLITTAKDWVKLNGFAGKSAVPINPVDLLLRFREDDEEKLLQMILRGR